MKQSYIGYVIDGQGYYKFERVKLLDKRTKQGKRQAAKKNIVKFAPPIELIRPRYMGYLIGWVEGDQNAKISIWGWIKKFFAKPQDVYQYDKTHGVIVDVASVRQSITISKNI